MTILAQQIEKRVDNTDSLSAAAPRQCLALLLAGGDGTRLQAFTAQLMGAPIPKQYCPLMHGRSLRVLMSCRLCAPWLLGGEVLWR